jgi:uncharacterized membrane protein YphA (DoxX/SURF4 family)
MNTTLWIIQLILAAAFGMAGIMKTFLAKEKLEEKMAWVSRFSARTVKFIGLTELLAAIGLVFPMLLNVLPILTHFAATGLCIVMILAAIHHARNKEYKEILINAVLFALSLSVSIGRMH